MSMAFYNLRFDLLAILALRQVMLPGQLVCLEWSERKSDCKFEFSMLRNTLVQFFVAIGATSCIWQHILRVLLEAFVIGRLHNIFRMFMT